MTRNVDTRSRWLMRAMEWNEPRARYPNQFRDDMPERLLLVDHHASRLRMGDLITLYYPPSERHPRRSDRFLGLSRVIGLMRGHAGHTWVDVETAHRFDPPLKIEEQPRRVFLCCDAGWTGPEVRLFRKVFAAAVAAGYTPREGERETDEPVAAATPRKEKTPAPEPTPADTSEPEPASAPRPAAPTAARASTAAPPQVAPPLPGARTFAGVDYSGDMRDPRGSTCLAIVELLEDDALRLYRLQATGRTGLQGLLRDPDASLMSAEAIGLDFPFGVPLPFAETLLAGPFPDEGWWALAKRFETLSRPDYLVALQEFREANGEVKRLTDEKANAFSPLHRVNPDLGPMTFHGIRMIAEDRSRYAVRPFEMAQGRLLLEVYPGATVRSFATGLRGRKGRQRLLGIVDELAALERWPLRIEAPLLDSCLASRDALDSVIAARSAAVAVLSGETERTAEELSPGEAARIRHEGWIYGVE
jgi:hypothetical protein